MLYFNMTGIPRIFLNLFMVLTFSLGLFPQCTNPSERIAVKTVAIENGVESESISYLNDNHLEFEILSTGVGDRFFVLQQVEKLTWSKGQPSVNMICIIEDSVSKREKVMGFTKGKEFGDRAEFLNFMTGKGYELVREEKSEYGEKLFFEKK